MLASKRHRILATVGHKNYLPLGTTSTDLQEVLGLIEPLGWPRYRLTIAGWAELERLGREALAQGNGTDAA